MLIITIMNNSWHCNNCDVDVTDKYCAICNTDNNNKKKLVCVFSNVSDWVCKTCNIRIFDKKYCIKCHKNENGEQDQNNDFSFKKKYNTDNLNNNSHYNNRNSPGFREDNYDSRRGINNNSNRGRNNDNSNRGRNNFREKNRNSNFRRDYKRACKDCGKQMSDEYLYCNNCDRDLPWKCLKCLKLNPKCENYCLNCSIDINGYDIRRAKIYGSYADCDFDNDFACLPVKNTITSININKCNACENKVQGENKLCFMCIIKDNIKNLNTVPEKPIVEQTTFVNILESKKQHVDKSSDDNIDSKKETEADCVSLPDSQTFEPVTDEWF